MKKIFSTTCSRPRPQDPQCPARRKGLYKPYLLSLCCCSTGFSFVQQKTPRCDHHHELACSHPLGRHFQQRGAGKTLQKAESHNGLGRLCYWQVGIAKPMPSFVLEKCTPLSVDLPPPKGHASTSVTTVCGPPVQNRTWFFSPSLFLFSCQVPPYSLQPRGL